MFRKLQWREDFLLKTRMWIVQPAYSRAAPAAAITASQFGSPIESRAPLRQKDA
jgi:hypothetical protein